MKPDMRAIYIAGAYDALIVPCRNFRHHAAALHPAISIWSG